MTLDEKVHTVLVDERGPIEGCAEGVPNGLSEFEADLLDWGCAYGIAFGLARAEEPCESNESVAKRALDAAKVAHGRYGSIHERRDGLEEARRVVGAFAHHGATREMHDVLCDLQRAVGSVPA